MYVSSISEGKKNKNMSRYTERGIIQFFPKNGIILCSNVTAHPCVPSLSFCT